jgi:integrase
MPKRRSRGEGTLYQRPDGLWCGQIVLPDGKRKTKYHATQKVVRDWLSEQRRLVANGVWASGSDQLFGDFLERYFQDTVAARVRPQTLANYRRSARNQILPTLAKIKLSALRPEHLQSLYANLSRSGLNSGTILIAHGVIRQALQQAMAWGLILRNPATLVRPPTWHSTPPRMLSPQELQKVLDATEGKWLHTLIVLAFTTGLRRGELLALKWDDIDLEKGTLHVHQGVVTVGTDTHLTEPKTRLGTRRVTLPQMAIDELKHYHATIARSNELLFPNRHGGLTDPDVVSTMWPDLMDKLGIERVTFHSLRHLHSTVLLEAGVSIKVLQERLGHAAASVALNTYSHVTTPMEKEAADVIDRSFKAG